MKCCVCGRDWPTDKCKVLVLTEAEKAYMRTQGAVPVTELAYCHPCWRVLSNPVQGAQLIKGTLQVQAQAVGISNAEQISERFMAKLLKLPRVQ